MASPLGCRLSGRRNEKRRFSESQAYSSGTRILVGSEPSPGWWSERSFPSYRKESRLIHRVHILGQHHYELTFAACAGEHTAAQNLRGLVIGEGKVDFRVAKIFAERFQLLFPADEFCAFDSGVTRSRGDDHKEISRAVGGRDFPQFDGSHGLQFALVLSDGGIDFGISADQSCQPRAGVIDGANSRE